jgi:hypothetical protein
VPQETENLIALIDEFFEKMWDHMRTNYKEKIKSTDMNLLQSCLDICWVLTRRYRRYLAKELKKKKSIVNKKR